MAISSRKSSLRHGQLKVAGDTEPYVKQQIEQNGASYIKMFHELGDNMERGMLANVSRLETHPPAVLHQSLI